MGFIYDEDSREYLYDLSDEIEPTKKTDEIKLTVCLETATVSIDVFHDDDGWQVLSLVKIYNNRQLKNLIEAFNGR